MRHRCQWKNRLKGKKSKSEALGGFLASTRKETEEMLGPCQYIKNGKGLNSLESPYQALLTAQPKTVEAERVFGTRRLQICSHHN